MYTAVPIKVSLYRLCAGKCGASAGNVYKYKKLKIQKLTERPKQQSVTFSKKQFLFLFTLFQHVEFIVIVCYNLLL